MPTRRLSHVCYAIDSVAGGGGAERALVAMAPMYAQDGIALDIVYLKDKPGLQDELAAAGARLFLITGSSRQQIAKLTHLLRDRRPDLIHTTLAQSNLVGRAAGTLARVPVVTSLVNVSYGPEYLADPGLRAWKVRSLHALDALTARRVRRFHALTDHVADVMAGRLRVPRARIDVIPRGRDAAMIGERTAERRAAARAGLGIADDTSLVLAAARHERQKGLDVLLSGWPAVLAAVADARLVIAGREGNQTNALQALVASHGLQDSVTFLGRRNDVPDLMCAADAFVVPSRWEGLGSVLVEAMALDVPIVAADIPPIRQTVGDEGNALLFAREDSAALAAAVVAVLTEPERARERTVGAKARFDEHYTLDLVWTRMKEFYTRALQ